MTSANEMKKLVKLAEIIRDHGTISKIDLVKESGISISYYEKLRPFIDSYFEDIEYDRSNRSWIAVQTEVVNRA